MREMNKFSFLMFFAACLAVCSFSLTAMAGTNIAQIQNPGSGKVIYVSAKNGENKNPGTKEQPVKDIDKAMKMVADGDTIVVAEGIYSGIFGVGYLECNKAVKLYGSFSSDFSKRDINKFTTLFQPDNASGGKARKALLKFTGKVDGIIVDGFVFDMGERNSYSPSEGKPEGVASGMLLLPPQKAGSQNPTVTEACISIPSAAPEGNVAISNNLFSNCANFGIQAGQRGGKFIVTNNVFVANRMAAIEIYGTCRDKGGPKDMSKCGETEISNNTILFTWSRLKDFLDMGYGVRVMTKLDYNIHDNLIGANIMAGVDHSRFNKNEWIKVDRNSFFVNKQADLEFSPQSNTSVNLVADQFGDLEIASADGNKNEIPKGLSIDKKYLEGFLSARYSEQQDYDPNSSANVLREVMGMNKQGKLKTKVSMFGNKYPWKEALKLFGAIKNAGAQAF
jgi:hypothetical protein